MSSRLPWDITAAGADDEKIAAVTAARFVRRLTVVLLLTAAALDLTRCCLVVTVARHPAPAAALCWLARDNAWQRSSHASVRQELAVVVEEHDSVAKQAPALLRMGGYRAGGVPVGGRRGRAPGKVVTYPGSGGGRTGRQGFRAG